MFGADDPGAVDFCENGQWAITFPVTEVVGVVASGSISTPESFKEAALGDYTMGGDFAVPFGCGRMGISQVRTIAAMVMARVNTKASLMPSMLA